ncbi:hypothetical protein IFM89_025622 [Coptis chinensis]|uniref:Uncharacterized protein n=1 Tax=Coptis chinensis TaxID=261450 RepID=A0A835H8U5_9MAGN|nr:hypothetical protein IFM89_025622 [Coptis chinensis]
MICHGEYPTICLLEEEVDKGLDYCLHWKMITEKFGNKVHGLGLEYWEVKNLVAMGKALGRPLYVDETTTARDLDASKQAEVHGEAVSGVMHNVAEVSNVEPRQMVEENEQIPPVEAILVTETQLVTEYDEVHAIEDDTLQRNGEFTSIGDALVQNIVVSSPSNPKKSYSA